MHTLEKTPNLSLLWTHSLSVNISINTGQTFIHLVTFLWICNLKGDKIIEQMVRNMTTKSVCLFVWTKIRHILFFFLNHIEL